MGAIITRVKLSRKTHAVYISYMDGEQKVTLILDPPEIVELFVEAKAKDEALEAAKKCMAPLVRDWNDHRRPPNEAVMLNGTFMGLMESALALIEKAKKPAGK